MPRVDRPRAARSRRRARSPQAETVLTIDQYVQRRLTRRSCAPPTSRPAIARCWRAIAKKYGVPARVLVAIWGMESNFGRFTGTRPTIQALATLAWEGRRGAFFTTELMNALQILDKGYIELDSDEGIVGRRDGADAVHAVELLAHAQDYDGDGRRDIWTTLPDVFASIANYMKAYGWNDDANVGPRGEGCRRAASRRWSQESACARAAAAPSAR